MPMNPRLLRPIASGIHPEAAAWRSAVVAAGGSPSSATVRAVNQFCKDIDAAGIRDRFYRLSLMCGSFLGVTVPLYRGQSRTGTQYGNTTDTNSGGVFVTGDYAENLGLLGSSGTPRKFLATGLGNDVLGATGHMAYYGSGDMTSTGTRRAMESPVSGVVQFLIDQRNGSVMFSNYQSGASFAASTGRTGSGMRLCQRTSATSLQGFFGATQETDAAGTASNNVTVVNSSDEFRVFSNTENFPFRISAYSLGLVMTSGQVAAYNTAMVAFQTALGRN